MEPVSLALTDIFFTTGSLGKPPNNTFDLESIKDSDYIIQVSSVNQIYLDLSLEH